MPQFTAVKRRNTSCTCIIMLLHISIFTEALINIWMCVDYIHYAHQAIAGFREGCFHSCVRAICNVFSWVCKVLKCFAIILIILYPPTACWELNEWLMINLPVLIIWSMKFVIHDITHLTSSVLYTSFRVYMTPCFCTTHAKVTYFLQDVCRVYPLSSSDHSQELWRGSYGMCLVGFVKLFCYHSVILCPQTAY